jgi:hypothetical protein
MEKILVLISNYGENQINYCRNLIDTLNSIKNREIIVKVFSSKKNNFENCEEIIVDNYQNHDFPNSLYDYLKNHQLSNYDYILFTENDLLFTEENFNTFFKYQKLVDEKIYSIGFWRYEIKNGEKFFIDLGYGENKISFIKNKVVDYFTEDLIFLKTLSVHQGCWLLRSDVVIELLPKINIGHTLEDKVSNYYHSENWPGTMSGIKQLIPVNDIEGILIHHQPNKYINIYSDLPSLNNLINEKKEFFK